MLAGNMQSRAMLPIFHMVTIQTQSRVVNTHLESDDRAEFGYSVWSHTQHVRFSSMTAESPNRNGLLPSHDWLICNRNLNDNQQDGQEAFLFVPTILKLYWYHHIAWLSVIRSLCCLPPHCHCPCPIDHPIVHYHFLCPHPKWGVVHWHGIVSRGQHIPL